MNHFLNLVFYRSRWLRLILVTIHLPMLFVVLSSYIVGSLISTTLNTLSQYLQDIHNVVVKGVASVVGDIVYVAKGEHR